MARRRLAGRSRAGSLTTALYDAIGRTYADHRQPDPRIAAYVEDALGDARTVVNVGAGTGSYESAERTVVAVEPSLTMIRQRSAGAVVQATAEAIPFPDDSFDAATAFITIHHWTDWRAGLAEMRRVAGRVLVLGIDLAVMDRTWLVADYFGPLVWVPPKMVSTDDVLTELGGGEMLTIPTPHDCVDGFFAAYWRRPEAYLDPSVRACISGLARADATKLDPIIGRLADDLESGEWHRRHGHLLDLEKLDTGMRLVVSR